MNSSFIPRSDREKATWLNHFANRLPQYASTLDFTNNEEITTQQDADCFDYMVRLQEATKQYWISVANLKRRLNHSVQQTFSAVLPAPIDLGPIPPMVADGIFDRVTVLVSRIKMHPAYTVAIGQDLGIVPPPAVPINPATMMPEFTVTLQGGYPLLKWKKGVSDGVHIYVDRQDGNGMVLDKRTIKAEYLDTHPLPTGTYAATWKYQIIYLLEDDEVGLPSTIISVNVFRMGS